MKSSITTLFAVLGIVCCAANVLRAETAAEMLEKGIYNEETVGNLDEAIKLYRQVVDVGRETEKLAAQAQYRLATCLLKQGKTDEATAAYKELVAQFPEQEELVARARKFLPDELKLMPPPWKDGERLTLTMKLPGGQTVGIIGTGVDQGKIDDQPIWRMAVRRFVASGQNEGVSEVVIDAASNRPLTTSWDHMLLGTSSSVWHDGQVAITSVDSSGKTETKTVDFEGVAYSNDQWFFGFRQLPLAIGFKVTIPLRVEFTGGNPVEMELHVDQMEKIKTPVGEFECFRLETNLAQTLWIADVPERYLVKFAGGGVEALLSSVTVGDTASSLENAALGLSLTVPKGWFHYELGSNNEDAAGGFQLVSPKMVSTVVSVKDKALLEPKEQASLDAWSADKIERAKRAYQKLELRGGRIEDLNSRKVLRRRLSWITKCRIDVS